MKAMIACTKTDPNCLEVIFSAWCLQELFMGQQIRLECLGDVTDYEDTGWELCLNGEQGHAICDCGTPAKRRGACVGTVSKLEVIFG